MKASQESPVFISSSSLPCFYLFIFFIICRAQHNLKSSWEKHIAVLQLPERAEEIIWIFVIY